MKKDNKKMLKIIGSSLCFITLLLIIVKAFEVSLNGQDRESLAVDVNANKKFVYLSDIPYIPENSSVGWGSITLDSNLETRYNNGLISLIVNGEQKSFLKGVSAHATSTLVYDIAGLNYDYFSTYYGVDSSRGANGNGVKFSIYTSVDGIDWTLHTLVSPPVKKGNTEAEHIDIDIRGKKYLKLYCHNNSNDTADHCAYANAKLYREGYVESEEEKPYSFIKTLDEYDNIIKNATQEELLTSKEQTLLQRKFVSNFGYEMLQAYAHLDEDRKAVVEWIMTDKEALKYYITGGKPTGSYMNSLNVLLRLYTTYKNDLKDNTQTEYTTLSNLYKRMMISLSLTHSANVCLWVGGNQCSDAVTRYAVYKKMHSQDLLINNVFERLNVEEMRWVMNNNIDDEEIEWLNHHIRRNPTSTMPYNTDPYHYITYRFGYNYNLPQYYDILNYDAWNKKYHLSDYNITYQTGKPKIWIVFEQGSVCGGLSKTGSNINGSLGNPSGVIGQPGHAAYLVYSQNAEGEGLWAIYNNVGGWTVAEKSERLLAGWGSNNWDSYYNVTYVPYTQEALNDIDNYNKALETMLLADLYQDDVNKLEKIYLKALEYQPINMDAWYGLIRTYQRNSEKTPADYIKLAKNLTDNMYYFPVPMYDLLNLIKGNLENTSYALTFTNYIRTSLENGTKLGTEITSPINQPAITRVMANHLLGNNDYNVANFSFDGENAKKIMLGSKYEGYGVRWEYSLDGGHHWTQTSESSALLTDAEISSITVENDIKIHIIGVNYSEENIYTIDISNSTLSDKLYNNDLENRVIGVDLTYEWRMNDSDSWTSYGMSSPDLTGNKTVEIRVGATGTHLPSSSAKYTFTQDNQPDTRKYVPVSHLSIVDYSSQSLDSSRPYYAPCAIDGNGYTFWHTNFKENVLTTGNKPFITIKLDKPRFISALEFKQGKWRDNDPVYIKNARIYVSEDGTNWKEAGKLENIPVNDELKVINFDESKEGQYIKIEMDTYSMFASLSLVNVFQDMTKHPRPTAGVAYSPANPTNGNVVARLENISAEHYKILSEGGDTHVFTDNGDFLFRFIDLDTNEEGSALARVNWIDRTAPTATIKFSTTSPTNKEVIATLIPSEDVTVLNNGNYTINDDGQILDGSGNVLKGFTVDDDGYLHDANGNIVTNINRFRYEFNDNGEFTFEFVDRAGNKGSATAKVNWIDKTAPTATLSYDIVGLTNKDVTVTLNFSEDNVKVTNNNGKNTYKFTENGEITFKFKDAAGNTNQITSKVNWIDKKIPTATLKYEKTNRDTVIVRVVNPSEEITYKDGNGVYEFDANGKYDIIIYDKAGNESRLTAVIEGLSKTNEDNNNNTNDQTNTPSNNTVENDNKNSGTTIDKPNTDNKNPNGSNNSNNNDQDESKESITIGNENLTKDEMRFVLAAIMIIVILLTANTIIIKKRKHNK